MWPIQRPKTSIGNSADRAGLYVDLIRPTPVACYLQGGHYSTVVL